MRESLDKWENFIGKLVEEEKPKVKEKIIRESEFLAFLNNEEEWKKGPRWFDEIESYYRKKWIQPCVIDPKTAYWLISGDEGYDFAKRWINSEMFDKVWQYLARHDIDEYFINEICEEKDFEKVFKETQQEKNSKLAEIIEFLKKSINEDRGNKKSLILLIEDELDISLSHSALKIEYENLKKAIGKVISRHELKNNFRFALVNEKDLTFHWIFWGLKWEYNSANLTTYILLHIWWDVKKGKKFSSNAVACLKNF